MCLDPSLNHFIIAGRDVDLRQGSSTSKSKFRLRSSLLPVLLFEFSIFYLQSLIFRHTTRWCPIFFTPPFLSMSLCFRSTFLFLCHWIDRKSTRLNSSH